LRKRDIKLDKYGISKKRYMELRSLCEQYPEWRQILADETSTVKSKVITGMPLSRDPMNNATESLAIRRAVYSSRCAIIENIAEKASKELNGFLIKSVCYGLPLNYLQTVEGLPYSRSRFYDLRRYFFYLLDLEMVKYEYFANGVLWGHKNGI